MMTPDRPTICVLLYRMRRTDSSVPQEPLTPTVFEGTGSGLGALNFTTLSPGLQREVRHRHEVFHACVYV